MALLAPHFGLPFRFGNVAEQGTGRDLANCVYAICLTPEGWREEAPYFGIPDFAFSVAPVFRDDTRQKVVAQEPRAEMTFSEGSGLNELERIIKVAVGLRTGAAL